VINGDNGKTLTFQVVLYEGSNEIRFNYKRGSSAGSSFNVAGIENRDGSIGLRYTGLEDASFDDGLSVLFYRGSEVAPPSIPKVEPAPQPELDPQPQPEPQQPKPEIEPRGGSQLYFPLLPADSDVVLGLVNLGDSEASGVLQAFGLESGSVLEESDEIVIKRHGVHTVNLDDLFSTSIDNIAYLVFVGDSDTPVRGFCCLVDNVNGGAASYPASPLPKAGAHSLYLPSLKCGDGWSTEINFVSVSDKKMTAVVQLGETVKTKILGAHQSWKMVLGDSFRGSNSVSISLSSMFETAEDSVVGAVLYRYNGRLMAATELRNEGESNLAIPYLADGDGWWSSMVFYNPPDNSAEQCSFESLTHVRMSDEPLVSNEFGLDKGEVEVFIPQKIVSGAYALELNNNCPLMGTAYIGQGDNDVLGAYSVSGIAIEDGVFARVQASSERAWSGLVIYNPNAEKASVVLTAYDDEGNVVAENGKLEIEAHKEVVGLPESLFEEDITEISHVEFKSSQGLCGLLLNFRIENDLEMLDVLPLLTAE